MDKKEGPFRGLSWEQQNQLDNYRIIMIICQEPCPRSNIEGLVVLILLFPQYTIDIIDILDFFVQ